MRAKWCVRRGVRFPTPIVRKSLPRVLKPLKVFHNPLKITVFIRNPNDIIRRRNLKQTLVSIISTNINIPNQEIRRYRETRARKPENQKACGIPVAVHREELFQ